MTRCIPFVVFIFCSCGSAQPLDPGHLKEAQALVRQLGDPDIAVRCAVENRLMGMGRAILPVLEPALHDQDPEIVCRAREVKDRLLNHPAWIEYRDSDRIGLEVQAARSEIVMSTVEEITLDPRAIIERLLRPSVALDGERFATTRARAMLERIALDAGFPLLGLDRFEVEGSLDLGCGSAPAYSVLKGLILQSGMDVMLTEKGELLLSPRRAVFEAIAHSTVRWPLRRFVGTCPFNLNERDPNRY